jgi:hypothetical protein
MRHSVIATYYDEGSFHSNVIGLGTDLCGVLDYNDISVVIPFIRVQIFHTLAQVLGVSRSSTHTNDRFLDCEMKRLVKRTSLYERSTEDASREHQMSRDKEQQRVEWIPEY